MRRRLAQTVGTDCKRWRLWVGADTFLLFCCHCGANWDESEGLTSLSSETVHFEYICSSSGCLFERKLCMRDQFCSDGEYSVLHTRTHTVYMSSELRDRIEWWCVRIYEHEWKIFPLRVFTSHSITCPSRFPHFYLSPTPTRAVSIATLTSRWGRHRHSCCANTVMSHWHTLTHWCVEAARTQMHGCWSEYRMNGRAGSSAADVCFYAPLWFWGENMTQSLCHMVFTLNAGNVSFGLSDSVKELNIQAQLQAERISLQGQQTLFF